MFLQFHLQRSDSTYAHRSQTLRVSVAPRGRSPHLRSVLAGNRMREKRATASDRLKPSRWMCVSRQFLCEVSRSRRCEGTAAGSSLQTPAEARRSRSPCRPCAGSEKQRIAREKTSYGNCHIYAWLCNNLLYSGFQR